MRNAINNNPKVQIAVIGVLVLLVAVVVLPSMMGHKGSSSSGTTTNTVSAQATGPTGSVDLTVKTTQPVPGAASTATARGSPHRRRPWTRRHSCPGRVCLAR